ncbi:MAG: DUF4838 domain-containing protein [Lentisphaeria bacterium]|nr:DUF4838 domain-containing protein [Lentisphaeria bacterium]
MFFRNSWFYAGILPALILFSLLTADGAVLVKNGKSTACIQLPANAGKVKKHAAKELAYFIEKQTGAKLPVTHQASPGKTVICFLSVEEAKQKKERFLSRAAEKIRHDGFVIFSGKNSVYIVAKEKRGWLYGVYRILTEFGDIYWLFPGEYGQFIPQKDSFTIPEMRKNYNPAFSQRKFRLNGGSGWTPDTYDWLMRNGLQLFCAKRTLYGNRIDFMAERDAIYNDGDGGLVPIMGSTKGYVPKVWEEIRKKNPEYFGFRNGKYCKPMESQPCTSNEAVKELILKHTLERLAQYPADRKVNWTISNDDHTNWCECKNCLALDDPGDERSNNRATRWWHLVNFLTPRILEKYKNVHIEAFAYQNFRFPPAKLLPDNRASVMICPHGRCYLHTLDDPSCPPNASRFKGMFDSWAEKGIQGTTFEYHPEMPGKVHYLFHERSWVKDLQYYHKLKMYGFGMVVTAPTDNYKNHRYGRSHFYSLRNSWEAHWQRYFLTGYYSWNIDANFDAISEKINSLWYGKTWKVMKKYRQELIGALYDSRVHMGYGTPTSVLGKCYERPGFASRVNALLAEAARLAKGDALLSKRIARDKEFFLADWVESYKIFEKSKQKEYNARKKQGEIVIDGKLDEMDWKETAFGTDFNVFDETKEVKADPQTFVRILYDADTLYFAIEGLKEKGIKKNPALLAREDGLRALEGSHFEIFLTPSNWNGKYYQLGFSLNGKVYQALTTSGSSRDFSLKLDPEFQCVELSDRWVLEAKVDISKLGAKISDGSVWKINIARAAQKKEGKHQLSSWSSNGVFHGSDVHRSVAFGSAGAVLRNGDVEDLVPYQERKYKKAPRYKWTFAGNMVPKYWGFNENNVGKCAIGKNDPASGKNYISIEGRNSFVDLYMNEPDKKAARYSITLSARGEGELFVSVRTDGKYSKAKNSSVKPSSKNKWTSYSLIIDSPAVKRGSRVLALRITGKIDIDNIQVQRIPEEEIPDAEKHK